MDSSPGAGLGLWAPAYSASRMCDFRAIVPAAVQRETACWGLPADDFVDMGTCRTSSTSG